MRADVKLILLSPQEWEVHASCCADYNYRQVWVFGIACAARLGASSEHVAVCAQGEPIALSDVRIKRIPILGAGIAYVNGGPLVRRKNVEGARALSTALEALTEEYVRRRGLVMRMALPPGAPEWLAEQAKVFTAAGFDATKAHTYRTVLVDLEPPLPHIRKALHQKWRNCLNRAEKNGLTVRVGSEPALFSEFEGLYKAMQARKPFPVDLGPDFYAAVQAELPPREAYRVAIAYHGDRPCAGHVGSILGETGVYLLGASNDMGLQQKASYLLQWDFLEAARAQGCRWYDLGGIDPAGNPGVYKFKFGLGGMDITVPGPYERASGPGEFLVRSGERLVRRLRDLRRCKWPTLTRVFRNAASSAER